MSEPESSGAADSSSEEMRTPSEPTDIEAALSQDDSPINDRLRSFDATISPELSGAIQIVGYEVMEERAKFTVFKLKVESKVTDESWFVFRRYTDFVRLNNKLRTEHPNIELHLPKKKWFGDNFNPNFLDDRIDGLQEFINSVMKHKALVENVYVRDFFCLDEPPSVMDNVEESRAIVEALEERIFHLQRQLKEKETAYDNLKAAHSVEIAAKLRLAGFVQECTRQCPSCAHRLSQLGQGV